MKPAARIESERLLLRPARVEDAPNVFEAYAWDPEVTRYLTWRPHRTVWETEQFLTYCEALWRDGKDFAYAILRKGSRDLVGMFGLHPMKLKVEVGYVLARPYWGQGYMTEALRTVINWALSQPEIFRVQAFCDVENPGSARVMEKAGMSREGLLRRYIVHPNISPEPRDCFLYAAVK